VSVSAGVTATSCAKNPVCVNAAGIDRRTEFFVLPAVRLITAASRC